MSPRRLIVPLAGALLAVLPATAGAATTVGSDLTRTPTQTYTCASQSSCTAIQTTLPGNAAPLTVPADGVITRWRVKTKAGTAAAVRLRVIRDAAGGQHLGVASSSSVVTSTAGDVQTFTLGAPSRGIPVQAGDHIGLDQATNAAVIAAPAAGAQLQWWEPALGDGLAALGTAKPDVELFFNADVEPDADRDGFGDETQDACPTDPTTQQACPMSLGVTSSSDRTTARSGEDVPLTVVVTNVGRNTASGGTLTWSVNGTIPRAVTLAASAGSCAPAVGGGIASACTLPDLPPGGQVVFTAVLRVAWWSTSFGAGEPGTARIESNAMLSSPRDPDYSDNVSRVSWTFTLARAPDATPPVLSVAFPAQRLGTVLRRGLSLRQRTDEAGAMTVEVWLPASRGRKALRAARATWTAHGRASRDLRLKLSADAVRRLRKVTRARIEVRVRAKDLAGNTARLTRRVTLRR